MFSQTNANWVIFVQVTPVLMVRQANLVQMARTVLTVETERLEMTEQKEKKERLVKLEKMAHQDSPVFPVLLETRDHLDLPGNWESKENLERKVIKKNCRKSYVIELINDLLICSQQIFNFISYYLQVYAGTLAAKETKDHPG